MAFPWGLQISGSRLFPSLTMASSTCHDPNRGKHQNGTLESLVWWMPRKWTFIHSDSFVYGCSLERSIWPISDFHRLKSTWRFPDRIRKQLQPFKLLSRREMRCWIGLYSCYRRILKWKTTFGLAWNRFSDDSAPQSKRTRHDYGNARTGSLGHARPKVSHSFVNHL